MAIVIKYEECVIVNSSKILMAFISVHGMTVCYTVTNKMHDIAACTFTLETLKPLITKKKKSSSGRKHESDMYKTSATF
jgi:hypothetical protein